MLNLIAHLIPDRDLKATSPGEDCDLDLAAR